MNITGRITRPFKNKIEGAKARVQGFVNPIKDALLNLRGKLPSSKAFAGSEDLADESDSKNADVSTKPGLMARLKSFKQSLKEMSDFQKLILITIAICLPAGILISTVLVGFIKKRKKK